MGDLCVSLMAMVCVCCGEYLVNAQTTVSPASTATQAGLKVKREAPLHKLCLCCCVCRETARNATREQVTRALAIWRSMRERPSPREGERSGPLGCVLAREGSEIHAGDAKPHSAERMPDMEGDNENGIGILCAATGEGGRA